MLTMLVAYDADGDVVATLDHLVATDEAGYVIGLVDFDAHELTGGELTDVWQVAGAVGSKTWPEWIGGRVYDFRVELTGPPGAKRISALVHVGHPVRTVGGILLPALPASGHRRERAAIEAAIAQRIEAAAEGQPADIRDIVGGPDRPLLLDDKGRTALRLPVVRPALPIVGLTR